MSSKREDATKGQSLYTPANFYMLRTPALSVHTFRWLAEMNSYSDNVCPKDEDVLSIKNECKQRIITLTSDAAIEQALAVASFSVLEGLALIRRDKQQKRADRIFSSLLRYLIRMSTRPTPFGLFSGVTVGTLAQETTVCIHFPAIQQIRVRPDMNWLLSIIQLVEGQNELLPHLHVLANQSLVMAGERVFLPYADIYGQGKNSSVSLRATPVVQYVLKQAKQAIKYSDLCTLVLKSFPLLNPEKIKNLLLQLWGHHFLISDLLPPLACTSPAQHVQERLQQLANVFPSMAEVNARFHQIIESIEYINQMGQKGGVEPFRHLMQTQHSLIPTGTENTFQADSMLQLKTSHLNIRVGTIAAQAATTLLRVGTRPRGLAHLEEYRLAFQERYGLHAELPLLDLLSPESGLDAPPGYQSPPRTYPLPHRRINMGTNKRNQILFAIVANALNECKREIELTESLLAQLESWSPQLESAPLSLEIYMQLHAESREAIDSGKWKAVISPNCGSFAGGKTFGRFFDLLGENGITLLQDFVHLEESMNPNIIFAELSYLPLRARAANVTIRPTLRQYEIAIGVTPSVPSDRVLRLDDLVIGIRDNRFYVRSIHLGKEIRICQTHMLNSVNAPNICRFLAEISMDGVPCLTPFDWGEARNAPFLPRLVQGNIVLSPAQWNLTRRMILPNETTKDGQISWFTSLQQWRRQWNVPRYVYLTEADNRLLLDLEHPLIAEELHTALERVSEEDTIHLQEMYPDFDNLWLQDEQNNYYIAEVVIPLIRKQLETSKTNIFHSKVYPVSKRERSIPPGSDWVYLKLYVPYEGHDELIANQLRTLVQECQERNIVNHWFFIRYGDPEPHIRLRLHTDSEIHRQDLLLTSLLWARQLTECGFLQRFSLDTYEREIERYGGPAGIEIIEQVFAIDSEVISLLVTEQYTRRITIDPLICAVFSLDYFFEAWGLSFRDRLFWVQSITDKHEMSKDFRENRRLLCELLAPWDHTHDPTVMTQRERMNAHLSLFKHLLPALASQIRTLSIEEKLWGTEHDILKSLAHMHINRLLGINRLNEQKVYTFWRHTLESIDRRPKV